MATMLGHHNSELNRNLHHGRFMHTENWTNAYQRNNKGGGLKNLRCFPSCRRYHVDRGYCGVPIYFQLLQGESTERLYAFAKFTLFDPSVAALHSYQNNQSGSTSFRCDLESSMLGTSDRDTNAKQDNDNSAILDSLSLAQEEAASILRDDLRVGDVVDLKKLQAAGKEERNPRIIYRGDLEDHDVDGPGVYRYVFNKHNKGWSYGWHGTKHTSQVKHCFTVFLFKAVHGHNNDKTSYVECCGVYKSPQFAIYSRKKARALNSMNSNSNRSDCSDDVEHANKRVKLDLTDTTSSWHNHNNCCNTTVTAAQLQYSHNSSPASNAGSIGSHIRNSNTASPINTAEIVGASIDLATLQQLYNQYSVGVQLSSNLQAAQQHHQQQQHEEKYLHMLSLLSKYNSTPSVSPSMPLGLNGEFGTGVRNLFNPIGAYGLLGTSQNLLQVPPAQALNNTMQPSVTGSPPFGYMNAIPNIPPLFIPTNANSLVYPSNLLPSQASNNTLLDYNKQLNMLKTNLWSTNNKFNSISPDK